MCTESKQIPCFSKVYCILCFQCTRNQTSLPQLEMVDSKYYCHSSIWFFVFFYSKLSQELFCLGQYYQEPNHFSSSMLAFPFVFYNIYSVNIVRYILNMGWFCVNWTVRLGNKGANVCWRNKNSKTAMKRSLRSLLAF